MIVSTANSQAAINALSSNVISSTIVWDNFGRTVLARNNWVTPIWILEYNIEVKEYELSDNPAKEEAVNDSYTCVSSVDKRM